MGVLCVGVALELQRTFTSTGDISGFDFFEEVITTCFLVLSDVTVSFLSSWLDGLGVLPMGSPS